MIKLKFIVIAIICLLGAIIDGVGGVYTGDNVSQLLRKLPPHETVLLRIMDALRGSRGTIHLGRRLQTKAAKLFKEESTPVQPFTKSGKTKSDKSTTGTETKSDKSMGTKSHKEVDGANSSKAESGDTSCAAIQTKLDACEAAATAPEWLFVQMADECTLLKEEGTYLLESSKFHSDTEWFTDRPFTYEKTQSTEEWFDNFDELFDDEKGMPNAALTIVDDDTSKDVVVSVFAEAYKKGDGYGYKLEQSNEQASIMSLDDLLDGKDSVTFDHCSMFIDKKHATGYQYYDDDTVTSRR